MERPPDRPRAASASRRACVALVLAWAGVGTAGWSWTAFGTLLPEERSWYYSVPGWVSLPAIFGVLVLAASWAALPLVLLGAGYEYLRDAGPPGWQWRGAWLGLVAAGIALDGLPFAFPMAFMSVTPNWSEFATSLGYAAAGTAMIFMLMRGAPGQRGPGLRRSADLTQHPS